MKKLNYAVRCILKAESLAEELDEEIKWGHVYKTIAAFWEVIELLLRAIIYGRKRTTYESPGKLISVFVQIIQPPYIRQITSDLNTLYNYRKRVIHKAILLNRGDVLEAKQIFCKLMPILLEILEKDGYKIYKLKMIHRNLCL